MGIPADSTIIYMIATLITIHLAVVIGIYVQIRKQTQTEANSNPRETPDDNVACPFIPKISIYGADLLRDNQPNDHSADDIPDDDHPTDEEIPDDLC